MKPSQLIDHFQQARGDTSLAVIEGVQALKHAVRFKASIECIFSSDLTLLNQLLVELAPDVQALITKSVEEVSEAIFNKLSPQPPRTRVIAIAQRQTYTLANIKADRPIVWLEDPRDLENIGAAIRVAAAANASAVCISGPADIWHPAVIRGAAGLQYAVPCFSNCPLSDIALSERKIIALDPTGTKIDPNSIDSNAILVFGTERFGVSQTLLDKSDQIIRLPMKSGVSSLNLATSVAATLYQLPV